MLNRTISKKFKMLAAGAVLAASFAMTGNVASAALLAPGSFVGSSAEAAPTGVVIGTVTSPFVTGSYSGSVTTTVRSGDTTSPFPGGLTFTYAVTMNALPNTGAVDRVNGIDYTGFQTDVSYVAGAGIAPGTVTRGANGQQIGFNFFGPELSATTSSNLLVVQTNATLFAPTTVQISDGSVSSVPSLGPVTPEPTSLGLIGLVGMGLLSRRRKA